MNYRLGDLDLGGLAGIRVLNLPDGMRIAGRHISAVGLGSGVGRRIDADLVAVAGVGDDDVGQSFGAAPHLPDVTGFVVNNFQADARRVRLDLVRPNGVLSGISPGRLRPNNALHSRRHGVAAGRIRETGRINRAEINCRAVRQGAVHSEQRSGRAQNDHFARQLGAVDYGKTAADDTLTAGHGWRQEFLLEASQPVKFGEVFNRRSAGS